MTTLRDAVRPRPSVLALLPALCALAAAVRAGDDPNAVNLDPYGRISFGPMVGQVLHFGPGWRSCHQGAGHVATREGSPALGADGRWSLDGEFSTREGEPFAFRQAVAPDGDDAYRVDYALRAADAAKGVQTLDLAVIFYVPAQDFAGRARVSVDGRAVDLPEQPGDILHTTADAKAVTFPYAEGRTVTIETAGGVELAVRDMRRHNEPRFGLQFKLAVPQGGVVREAAMALTLRFKPGRPPLAAAAPDPKALIRVYEPGEHWTPLGYDPTPEKDSALDFSFLLDAPAGKHGAVVVRDGRFEFENRPGSPARFFGTNAVYEGNFPPKEKAPAVADQLARTGYNAFRFHHFDHMVVRKDGADSTVLDPDRVERMDFFIAELKKRGLYVSIDLYSHRAFRDGELKDVPAEFRKTSPKTLIPLHPEARASWKRLGENLLRHVNPHTGLAWKDDPALFAICLVNEGNLQNQWHWHGGDRPFIAARYNEWAAANGRPAYADDLPADQKAAALQSLFGWLADAYAEFHADALAWLRGMGTKALVSDLNYIPLQGLAPVREALDYVDMHGYWDHPATPQGWGYPFRYDNKPALPTGFKGAVGGGIARLVGKPFAVTEFNYCFPNPTRMEGGPYTGAYAALQGHDAVFRFDMGAHDNARASWFSTGNDPVSMLSERLALAMFLRGDVKASENLYAWVVPADRARQPGAGDYAKDMVPDTFLAMQFVGRVGTVVDRPGRTLPAEAAAAFGDARPSDEFLAGRPFGGKGDINVMKGGSLDPWGKKQSLSDTGEIALAWPTAGDARMTVAAPRAASVSCMGAGTFAAGALTFVNEGEPAVAGVISLDGRPIASSERLLVLHLRDVKNTGIRFGNGGRDVLDWGRLPHLAARGRGTFALALDRPEACAVYALDATGRRLGPVDHAVAAAEPGGGAPVLRWTADTRWRDDAACLAYEVTRRQGGAR